MFAEKSTDWAAREFAPGRPAIAFGMSERLVSGDRRGGAVLSFVCKRRIRVSAQVSDLS